MSGSLVVPAAFAMQHRDLAWQEWIAGLPRRVGELVDTWELTVLDGPTRHGYTSIVVPVVESGRPVMLKLTFDGDVESEFEGLALQRWAGDGAVRMYRSDPSRRALLLERLGDDLTEIWDQQACEIVGSLYPRLHIPAPPQVATVTSYLHGWLASLASLPRDAPIPRRLVEQALSAGRTFLHDPASTGRLIHGDLHYENVLAAEREPWLAIDPKPMSGDPHYELAPMLWNRLPELGTGRTLRDGLRERFFTLVDTAGMDEERARAWAVVRLVMNGNFSIADATAQGRPLNDAERNWITSMVVIAKAIAEP